MTNEKAPERVWIWTSEPYQWHDTKTDDSDVEYARVSRHYFCSCGAALTAEEYITHLFELGHDRGNPAFTAAPVVDNQWFELALRYLRGDPTLTDLPFAEGTVFADFLLFWDAQTPHFRSVIKSVFQAAPHFTVSATAAPVKQTVYVSEHPVTLRCNTCGLVQVKSCKRPRGDGQLVVGAASVEQSESQ